MLAYQTALEKSMFLTSWGFILVSLALILLCFFSIALRDSKEAELYYSALPFTNIQPKQWFKKNLHFCLKEANSRFLPLVLRCYSDW